jgi:hypothetical protein
LILHSVSGRSVGRTVIWRPRVSHSIREYPVWHAINQSRGTCGRDTNTPERRPLHDGRTVGGLGGSEVRWRGDRRDGSRTRSGPSTRVFETVWELLLVFERRGGEFCGHGSERFEGEMVSAAYQRGRRSTVQTIVKSQKSNAGSIARAVQLLVKVRAANRQHPDTTH